MPNTKISIYSGASRCLGRSIKLYRTSERGDRTEKMRILLFHFLLPVLSAFASAPKGPWDNFNIAPLSRTVYPAGIHSTNGSVVDANLLVGNKGPMTLSVSGSWAALDFGLEVRFRRPHFFGEMACRIFRNLLKPIFLLSRLQD